MGCEHPKTRNVYRRKATGLGWEKLAVRECKSCGQIVEAVQNDAN